MQTIDPARLTAVKIVSTQVEGDDMLRLAAQSFGLATEGFTKAATLQKIEGYLHGQARAGRRSTEVSNAVVYMVRVRVRIRVS